MNPAAYIEMAETESRHWWFCGRRAILTQVLKSLNLPRNSKILELGCGTGGNLEMLSKFGEVSALEMDDTARAIAQKNTAWRHVIKSGSCPDSIPFDDNSFDLICMFDVLEHIEHDTETLMALRRLLKSDGLVLITVPAYQWLFGAHDEYLHHKRRYSAPQLQEISTAAGLHEVRTTYFNTLLFPLAALVRLKEKLLGNAKASGTVAPNALINFLFAKLFGSERFLINHFNLPFGVSLLCVLENRAIKGCLDKRIGMRIKDLG